MGDTTRTDIRSVRYFDSLGVFLLYCLSSFGFQGVAAPLPVLVLSVRAWPLLFTSVPRSVYTYTGSGPIYSLSGVTSQIPDNRVKYENIPKLG